MKTENNRWLYPLAALGAAATVRGAFSLFAETGRRPNRMWTDGTPPVDSEDFLRPLAAILGVPVQTGGHLTLLNNGDEWLDAMLADFDAAEHSINFSAYMWQPGRISDMIFDSLIERARSGIQVRVLLDALGGQKCPKEGIEQLEAAGGHVCQFRPFRIGKIDRFHLRNHRRAIVIDGKIGYTGGMAVVDHWLGDARNEHEWRDIMTRLTGCLAQSVQSAFAELWAYVCGEVLTGPEYFPHPEPDGSTTKSLAIVSSPSSEEHPLHLLFFKSFMAARNRLWITTPYFVPDKHTVEVLAARARDGIDVRLLLPNERIDAKLVRWAGQSAYETLLEAGVRIFEYQPSMLHTKAFTVDGKWSVIGSANMDVRSKELNEENVIGILDEEYAQALDNGFLRDLNSSCEIQLDDWKRRGIHARMVERCASVFSEQY
jgi:cardiolipin synthase